MQAASEFTNLDDDDDWDESSLDRTYLICLLADERYALAIRSVVEILQPPALVPVPDMPPYICGAANIKGNVVPVLDLRVRFKQRAELGASQRRVLVLLDGGEGLTGVLVDAVTDAIEIGEDQIDVRNGSDASCVRGLASHPGDTMSIVLDLPTLLSFNV